MNLSQVRRWVAAAIADGWTAKPVYEDEPVHEAASLERWGFKVMAIMRPAGGHPYWCKTPEQIKQWTRTKDDVSISAWGPDGLAVEVPEVYNFEAICNSAKTCFYCKATGPTVRIGFAGRCCPACREKHAAEVEKPGWCD